MKYRASLGLALLLSLLALGGLLAFPAQAADGARRGLYVCGSVIVPSLFPFAALSKLLLELRFPERLGRLFQGAARKIFGVSGRGAAAFFLGLTGGYPLGAVTVSEMYSSGQIGRREASSLLGFCDNSGPAFIVSAVGTAVFASPTLGLCLYAVHIIAAVATGALLRSGGEADTAPPAAAPPAPFSLAVTRSVKSAAVSAVTICGFVVFFSVLAALLDASGLFPALCGALASGLGLELRFTRALLLGLLELGSATAALQGLPATPENLALASFILAWGGLSVQAQAAASLADCGLPLRRHLLGKLLHALIACALTLMAARLFL